MNRKNQTFSILDRYYDGMTGRLPGADDPSTILAFWFDDSRDTFFGGPTGAYM